jgi:hypothetical protein
VNSVDAILISQVYVTCNYCCIVFSFEIMIMSKYY